VASSLGQDDYFVNEKFFFLQNHAILNKVLHHGRLWADDLFFRHLHSSVIFRIQQDGTGIA